MDYSLAALKVLSIQLKDARETASQKGLTLGGILFQRAWLQGLLVSSSPDGNSLLLDDGTGVIHLSLTPDFRLRPWNVGNTFSLLFFLPFCHYLSLSWFFSSLNLSFSSSSGKYVMVVGAYDLRSGEIPTIKVTITNLTKKILNKKQRIMK